MSHRGRSSSSSAGRLDLLPMLREGFGADLIVVEDRRLRERRQTVRPVAVDRRSGDDRRQPLTEVQLWQEAGYRIVYRAADASPAALFPSRARALRQPPSN